MMKKLLILMLVLGLASSANAAFTLVSSAGDSLDPTGITLPNITMIGIYNDTLGANLADFLVSIQMPAVGSWTGGNNIYHPPVPATVPGSNVYYGSGIDPSMDVWYSELSAPVADKYGVGILADFEFQCDALGDVTIDLYDASTMAVLDSIVIHQIPEPATMLLLGLGGLFLRRRK